MIQIRAGCRVQWQPGGSNWSIAERAMTHLWMIIFSIVSATLIGTGVIVMLTTGYDTLTPVLTGAAIGLVLAFPVSWFVMRRLL